MNIQQTTAGQLRQKQTTDFHDKYGNAVLDHDVHFLCCCISIYAYTANGMEWKLSPFGRVTPKKWINW
uniref:Cytochrome c oxidase subunit 7B, mitochondrial n=1 Tax=Suricata suricatta TaxID=37032 RepID=A0A673U145_SURSU